MKKSKFSRRLSQSRCDREPVAIHFRLAGDSKDRIIHTTACQVSHRLAGLQNPRTIRVKYQDGTVRTLKNDD